MKIFINTTPLTDELHEHANLEDLLVQVAETRLPPRHLVASVRVNGKDFSESYPGQSKNIRSEDIEKLEIGTVPFATYAAAAMTDCAMFLDQIIASTQKTAELFRMSDDALANRHFVDLIDSLRAFFNFIHTAQKTLEWNFSQPLHDNSSIADEWTKLHEMIDEIKNTQEESDWILLADLLEYELVPALGRWISICREQAQNNKAA